MIDFGITNLILVHFESQSLQPRSDGGEERLHVGELHRDEVELDEVLQRRHVPPRPEVVLVHHSSLKSENNGGVLNKVNDNRLKYIWKALN